MATTATKVRLNKGRCISGMDGVNVEYTIQLDGMENLYLPVKEEKNEADNTIVSISCVGGKVSAYVNPVHAIRQYNVKPLGIVESIKLEIAKNRVLEIMKSYLQEHLKDKYSDDFVDSLQVVKLECNVTMRTLGNATPDTMLHFFDMVFPDTFLHRYRKAGSKCEKGDNSVKYKKDGCYILKCYDKGEEGAVIKKPKTATSIRTVTFPDDMTPLLKQYRSEYNQYRFSLGTAWQGDGNLFIQDDGKLMGRSTSYQAYKRHIRRYNEWVRENPEKAKKGGYAVLPEIPLHGLRHSCATLLNYLEVNIIDISKILGHAKSSTTMDIYAHSFDEQNTEVANKLNDFLVNNKRKQA